jgi:hypothetical protein
VPARAAAAAKTLVWTLHPTSGGGLASAEARATLTAAGGDISRFANCIKRAPFYADVAGIKSADVPTLLCSLARTFTAAGAGGAAVVDALARLSVNDDAQHGGGGGGGGGECADEACGMCASRRAAGTMCALPTCSQRGSAALKLKVCARCGRAAYCSRACQQQDWARHRRQDCVAAAATPAA